MVIYDKYLDKIIDIPKRQAEIMLKYKPGRYIRPAEVNDVEPPGEPTGQSEQPTKPIGEPTKGDSLPTKSDKQPANTIDATKGAIEAGEELGIDLSDIPVEGRITKSDVINFNK